MAKTVTYACSRCGVPYSAPEPDDVGSSWFTNTFNEACHLCSDGVIGGKVESDEVDTHSMDMAAACPICGQVASLAGMELVCKTCLISRPADNENALWELMDLGLMLLSGNNEAEALVRHFNMACSLSGWMMNVSQIAKLLCISQKGDYPLPELMKKDPVIKIACGSCYEKDIVITKKAPVMVRPRQCRAVAPIPLELSLACQSCGRNDWYIHNTDKGLWIWVLSAPPTDSKIDLRLLKAGEHSGGKLGDLTESERRELNNRRPEKIIKADKTIMDSDFLTKLRTLLKETQDDEEG